MIPLPLGVIILGVLSLLVFLGLTERVLDRMKISDRTAFVLIALLLIAHFIPAIPITSRVAFNLGALVPLGMVVYLLATTSRQEQSRAIFASIVTAALLWLSDRLLPIEPGQFILDVDPLYLGGLIAGVIAYVFGRSRRSAFIGAVFGILLVDLVGIVLLSMQGINQTTIIGGGGVFDALIIGGVIAVGLAEFVGEINERLHRGPAKLGDSTDEENRGDDNEQS